MGRGRKAVVASIPIVAGMVVGAPGVVGAVPIGPGCQFPVDKAGVSVGLFSTDSNVVAATQWTLAAWTPGPEAPPVVASQGGVDVVVVSYSAPSSGASAWTTIASADPANDIAPRPTCGADGWKGWTEQPWIWANTAIFGSATLGTVPNNMSRIGHELGHTYGLQHPKSSGAVFGGCNTSDNSLMWWNQQAFNACGTKTLQPTDIAGLTDLYK